ncbi:MAG: Carbohydrate-selective porin OprB [Enterovirga sp.]|nr:Carbohydrate-selective porin OprB [Enterovirga sp.]
MWSEPRRWSAIAGLGVMLLATGAAAQTPPGGQDGPAGAQISAQSSEREEPQQPSIQSALGPYGDPGGLRGTLQERGVTYNLVYIGETLGNVSGGMRRGAVYQGRLDLQLDANLDRLVGWQGATFHTNAYVIHGGALSRSYLGNLFVSSGIEARPSERLFELWLDQELFNRKVSIRAGQLAADTEFLVSETAGLFVNATFGWPTITAANLPSGGPAYPLAAPGIRLKLAPTEDLTLRFGLFDGDPAGPQTRFNDPDPLQRNKTGTNFRTRDPAFAITEAAYAYRLGPEASALPGTAKLGYWRHFGRFDDQRLDESGLSLADAAASGTPRRLRGNDGIYGILDQAIYRVPGSDDQGVSVFARLSASPSDRNLVDVYADGGIALKGMIPGRSKDTVGLGLAYGRISGRAAALDRDQEILAGSPIPVRTSEAMLEITYQAEIVPGFTLQPDFQYILRPSGKVANPRDPDGRRIGDAAVLGLRAAVRY